MNTLSPRPWALLLFCVALSAVAQLLLKYGMSRGTAPALSADPRAILMLLLKPPVLIGLVIYFAYGRRHSKLAEEANHPESNRPS